MKFDCTVPAPIATKLTFLLNPLIERFTYFFSGLCVIHCLSTPLVLLLLPAFAPMFSTTIEALLILAMVPLAFFAFLPSWLKHRNTRLLIFFLTGVCAILCSQFFFHPSHNSTETDLALIAVRSGLMMMGAVLMAYSIYKNRRHTHVCTVPDHHH